MVETRHDTQDAAGLAEALDAWWRDAGVDLAFVDSPRDWLAEAATQSPAPAAARPAATSQGAEPTRTTPADPRNPARLVRAASAPAPPAALGGHRDSWPQTLDAFAAWWTTEPSLDARRDGRIAPSGPRGAPFMVLVAHPEREDRTGLLTGPEGRLLDAMLRAMGTTREAVYCAAALPRHTPAADWPALGQAGLGTILRHQVALAAPERLLIFGHDVVALLAPEEIDSASRIGSLHGPDESVALLAGKALSAMIERPAFKAAWWQRYCRFIGKN